MSRAELFTLLHSCFHQLNYPSRHEKETKEQTHRWTDAILFCKQKNPFIQRKKPLPHLLRHIKNQFASQHLNRDQGWVETQVRHWYFSINKKENRNQKHKTHKKQKTKLFICFKSQKIVLVLKAALEISECQNKQDK